MIDETKFINLLFDRLSVQRKSKKGGGLYPKKMIENVLNIFKHLVYINMENENVCQLINTVYLETLLFVGSSGLSSGGNQPTPTLPSPTPSTPNPVTQTPKPKAECLYIFLDKFNDFIKTQRSTYLTKSLFDKIETSIKGRYFYLNDENDFYDLIKNFSFDKFKELSN